MMNKKGYWFSSVTGLILFFFLLITAIVGISTLNNEKQGYQTWQTINNMTWKTIHPDNDTNLKNSTLGMAVYDTVNLVGKYTFEFSKVGAEYGYKHPDVPWKFIVLGIIIAILAPIFYYVFMGMVVLVLLISEWRKNKKEQIYLDSRKKEVQK